MKNYSADLYRGIVKENPTFVLFLGMCPTLALTNNLSNAIGMGVSVVVVLSITNTLISLIRKIIPGDIRIPVYITVIASVVTVLGMLMEAYLPALFESLGIYLPLIVVNCIILGRAEAFASTNGVMDSFMDGIASGLGFLLGLSTLAFFRELIGTGAVELLNFRIIDAAHAPVIFVQSSGAFLMFGFIAWMINTIKLKKEKEEKLKKALLIKEKMEKAKLAKEAKEKLEKESSDKVDKDE
ncbi:RnfABCDGE type electron transport complex subunit E [Thiospirochaeta perfilievii]|uniref:Ion-translocating oxidoreductase complex subunit E n=1 Tax=Thiospirochaeta perfilievii TaxID=252967 RepID=A0A5C1Q950_9SPIO|nr:electron transport complex subunit RsxE [Thiospirochaeta perfilievii]QEN03184.1 RnfABCDGE type electron transport complex subunit E [Thiospirochaeta perfilievii]